MNLGIRALQMSTQIQRFNFDEQTYTIRRNLMIISSLAVASTFVSPLTTGKYEINMGIIKGNIDNPILLYLFLAVSCIYYLIWFYIHCKRLVVRNYEDIKRSFHVSLAQLNAKAIFQEFTKDFEPRFQGTPDFIFKGGSPTKWKVGGNLNSHAIRNHANMVDELKTNSPFVIENTSDGISLDYEHTSTTDDLVYLSIHLDQYWRTRKEEAFITLLPIGYAVTAISLIGLHIYALSQS